MIDARISIDPTESQESITAHLRSLYPHIPVFEDALIDSDHDEIKTYSSGQVKPFIILWYRQPKLSPRGRSFGGYKLDQRHGSVDLLVVGRSGGEARKVLNRVMDDITGWRPTNSSGGLHESTRSLWDDARSMDVANRPTRWAATQTFDWGLAHSIKP